MGKNTKGSHDWETYPGKIRKPMLTKGGGLMWWYYGYFQSSKIDKYGKFTAPATTPEELDDNAPLNRMRQQMEAVREREKQQILGEKQQLLGELEVVKKQLSFSLSLFLFLCLSLCLSLSFSFFHSTRGIQINLLRQAD